MAERGKINDQALLLYVQRYEQPEQQNLALHLANLDVKSTREAVA